MMQMPMRRGLITGLVALVAARRAHAKDSRPSGQVQEAPQDGQTYGRRNGGWVTVGTGRGGVTTSRFGHNVLDHGADPNGRADSVGAFEAAMMASGGGAYGKILVPLGAYRFSRSCNLDIINTRPIGGVQKAQAGYIFEGEGHTSTRFGTANSSSLIIGPPNDYAFKSTLNGSGNSFNSCIFERLHIQGSGYL
jgi:hypothetical protein